MKYANIKFDSGDHPETDIRVGFTKWDGHWSRVGNSNIRQDKPTNLAIHDRTSEKEFAYTILYDYCRTHYRWDRKVVLFFILLILFCFVLIFCFCFCFLLFLNQCLFRRACGFQVIVWFIYTAAHMQSLYSDVSSCINKLSSLTCQVMY